jgi:uncharacterized Tic20 family protein
MSDKNFGLALAISAVVFLVLAVGFKLSGRKDDTQEVVAFLREFQAMYFVLALAPAVASLCYLQ